jgi:transcriptional regulator with XRE-family HTH domain
MTPEEMRSWRKRLGLTQEQAGEVLGVTSRAIAKWESKEAPIDKRTKLATQRYEQTYINRHGISGRPLLFTVHVDSDSSKQHEGETYLVIARQDFEADKFVYAKMGEPTNATLTAAAVAKVPLGASLGILGSVSELIDQKNP